MNPAFNSWHGPTRKDGPVLSKLIQGYWRMLDWNRSPQQHLEFLQRHLDLGISAVDHADVYGDYAAEQAFGEVLALDPGLRDRIQIITKCDIKLVSPGLPDNRIKHYDTSASHIRQSVERSLSCLRTDRIDLLLLHRPDPLMRAEEVAEAFRQLHQEGKVLHFGVSNFSPRQFDLLQSRLGLPLATNQVEINPVNTQILDDGTLDHLQMHGIRPMAWSCLAGGRLFDDEDEVGLRVRQVLQQVGEDLGGFDVDQVAFAWVLALPSDPMPILGSSQILRAEKAIAATELRLSKEQWFAILAAARGHAVA